MPNRLVNALLACLIGGLCAHALYLATGLPPTVASHFAADGQANGFLSKTAHMVLWTLLLWVVPCVVGFVPLEKLSAGGMLLNMPHKAYWMSPERRTETLQVLQTHMKWLAVLLVGFLAWVHQAVVQAHSVPTPLLPMANVELGLRAFLAAVALWSVTLWWRFRRRS